MDALLVMSLKFNCLDNNKRSPERVLNVKLVFARYSFFFDPTNWGQRRLTYMKILTCLIYLEIE